MKSLNDTEATRFRAREFASKLLWQPAGMRSRHALKDLQLDSESPSNCVLLLVFLIDV